MKSPDTILLRKAVIEKRREERGHLIKKNSWVPGTGYLLLHVAKAMKNSSGIEVPFFSWVPVMLRDLNHNIEAT